MKKRLIFAFTIILVNLSGNCQSYADVKFKKSEEHTIISVMAASSNQLYTDNDPVAFEAIDSIVFYYQPTESLLANLGKYGVHHSIKMEDLEHIEKPITKYDKSGADWVVLTNRDTLFGFVEERRDKIVFDDPLKHEYQKIPHYQIRSYKKDTVIYENIDGMKVVMIKGNLSLYSTEWTYMNSGVCLGSCGNILFKFSYFLLCKKKE